MSTINLRILLADDDDDDCSFFEEALAEIQIPTQLEIVRDGAELIKYLSINYHQMPDVLFLDLNMPIKNGFECVEEIKLNEQLKNLPVIILSNSRQENIINLLRKIGADYFIRKSGSFAKLKRVIHYALTIIATPQTNLAKETFVLNNADT